MRVQHGDRAKDLVSGYQGIVVAITEWLNGCLRITIQAEKTDKDGKPIEAQTFDEPQITLVKTGVVARPGFAIPAAQRTGGPVPEPRRQPSIRR